MTEKTKTLYEIWENGIPLKLAFQEFGNKDVLAAYDVAKRTELHFILPKTYDEHPNLASDGSNRNELLHECQRQINDLYAENEYYLCKDFRTGRLVGLGYALPRHPTDTPAYIPGDVWNRDVDIGKNIVKGNGLEFVEVRVFKPGDEETSRRSPGRPSRQDQIIRTFEVSTAE